MAGYIGALEVTKGPDAGKPFQVLPYQREFLDGAFDPDVAVAALSVPRANGKTTFCAALAAAVVDPDGPLHGPRTEAVVVAGSLNQGAGLFEHARHFLMGAGYDILNDRATWRVTTSHSFLRIEHKPSGASVIGRAAQPDLLHGLDPTLILCDEPARWMHTTAREVFAALVTSLGKAEGARLVALGTSSPDPDHWYRRLCEDTGDPGTVAVVYDAPMEAEWSDPKVAERANPAWDHFPALRAAIHRERRSAMRDPALQRMYRALRLNQPVEAVEGLNIVVDTEVWRAVEVDADALPPAEGVLLFGLDVGGSKAASAVAAFWPETGRLEAFAAFPPHPSIPERQRKDGVSTLYDRAVMAGDLVNIGRRTMDVAALIAHAVERWGRPARVIADSYQKGETIEAVEDLGLPCEVTITRHAFEERGRLLKAFRAAVRNRTLAVAPNLMLRFGLSEARVVSGPGGVETLATGSKGGRRQLARDDILAAAILAVGVGRLEHGARPDYGHEDEGGTPEGGRKVVAWVPDETGKLVAVHA